MTVIQGNATWVRNDPDNADPLTAIEAESRDITARNEPDRGATFEIRLPLVDDAGA